MSEKLEPFEVWGTIAEADRNSGGRPSICVWGTRATAEEGRDPDEKVCRMRIDVLEIVEP